MPTPKEGLLCQWWFASEPKGLPSGHHRHAAAPVPVGCERGSAPCSHLARCLPGPARLTQRKGPSANGGLPETQRDFGPSVTWGALQLGPTVGAARHPRGGERAPLVLVENGSSPLVLCVEGRVDGRWPKEEGGHAASPRQRALSGSHAQRLAREPSCRSDRRRQVLGARGMLQGSGAISWRPSCGRSRSAGACAGGWTAA